MKQKGLILGILIFLCLAIGVRNTPMYAKSENTKEKAPQTLGDTLPKDTVFTQTTKDGKIKIRDKKQINLETMVDMGATNALRRSKNVGGAREITYGVVNFRTKMATQNTSFTDVASGQKGYTNGTYQADGAYLGYENGKIKFMQAGVIGLVNPSEVQVLEYDDVDSVNYYAASQGNFYHYMALNVYQKNYDTNLFGKQPSYIKTGSFYYSYDGHYFYTSYAQMIKDYKAGTRKNSVNPTNPYFNYYQFASLRTKTSYTANDLNTYVSSYLGKGYASSKLYNAGQAMIDAQNKYGVNALLTLGIAINESSFGTSNLALTKNNLFGLNAVDADPNKADTFPSPSASINDFAKYYANLWYSTPGTGSTYHGAFLGDKASGMNVSYASDPNWGEKAAAWMSYAEKYVNKSDVGKDQIGFKDAGSINIRKEATTSSTNFYTTPGNTNMAFIILGEVNGQSIDGSNKWYKIQLDPSLNASRTAIDRSGNGYDFANSYGYVHSSLLSKAIHSNDGGSSNPLPSGYKKGDVNGNGEIDAADYLMIKDSILGKLNLNDKQKKAADVNQNGIVDAADYLMIKDYILGKITF